MKLSRKWKNLIFILILVMLLTSVVGCSDTSTSDSSKETSSSNSIEETSSNFEERVIRSSYTYSSSSLIGSLFQDFQDRVTELTDGAITFDTYWSASLIDADSALDGIGSGVAEIGNGLPVRTPTLTPMGGASFYFPFRPEDLSTTYSVMQELIESFPEFAEETEKYGVKMVSVIPTSGMQICSTTPITSYKDLEGLKVAAAGSDYTVWESVGAVVVSIAGDSRYENLQRGVIDASYLDLGSIYADHHYEVAPYVTYTGLGDLATCQLWCNLEFWDSLSVAEQEVIQEAIDYAINEYIIYADEYLANAVEEMEAEGVIFYTLSDDDKAEWASQMDNLPMQFAEILNELGVDGDGFVQAFIEACENAGHVWNRDWLEN